MLVYRRVPSTVEIWSGDSKNIEVQEDQNSKFIEMLLIQRCTNLKKSSATKISNKLINDLQESENKVFCLPTGTFSSNWRLPSPKTFHAVTHPSGNPTQYSGYSDFTAISEALKSGVTTAFRVIFSVQIHPGHQKGQCSIGNPGCRTFHWNASCLMRIRILIMVFIIIPYSHITG